MWGCTGDATVRGHGQVVKCRLINMPLQLSLLLVLTVSTSQLPIRFLMQVCTTAAAEAAIHGIIMRDGRATGVLGPMTNPRVVCVLRYVCMRM